MKSSSLSKSVKKLDTSPSDIRPLIGLKLALFVHLKEKKKRGVKPYMIRYNLFLLISLLIALPGWAALSPGESVLPLLEETRKLGSIERLQTLLPLTHENLKRSEISLVKDQIREALEEITAPEALAPLVSLYFHHESEIHSDFRFVHIHLFKNSKGTLVFQEALKTALDKGQTILNTQLILEGIARNLSWRNFDSELFSSALTILEKNDLGEDIRKSALNLFARELDLRPSRPRFSDEQRNRLNKALLDILLEKDYSVSQNFAEDLAIRLYQDTRDEFLNEKLSEKFSNQEDANEKDRILKILSKLGHPDTIEKALKSLESLKEISFDNIEDSYKASLYFKKRSRVLKHLRILKNLTAGEELAKSSGLMNLLVSLNDNYAEYRNEYSLSESKNGDPRINKASLEILGELLLAHYKNIDKEQSAQYLKILLAHLDNEYVGKKAISYLSELVEEGIISWEVNPENYREILSLYGDQIQKIKLEASHLDKLNEEQKTLFSLVLFGKKTTENPEFENADLISEFFRELTSSWN